MHMIFTDKEKEWIRLDVFGWPVKSGCPTNILKTIEHKKKIIDLQNVLSAMNKTIKHTLQK